MKFTTDNPSGMITPYAGSLTLAGFLSAIPSLVIGFFVYVATQMGWDVTRIFEPDHFRELVLGAGAILGLTGLPAAWQRARPSPDQTVQPSTPTPLQPPVQAPEPPVVVPDVPVLTRVVTPGLMAPPHPLASIGQAPWKWSRASQGRLQLTRDDLRLLMVDCLPYMPYDIGIIAAMRTSAEQSVHVASGASQTMDSRHLDHDGDGTSDAIDFGVYVNGAYINGDTEPEKVLYRMCAEVIRHRAAARGVAVRLGTDWDFSDIGHVEVIRLDHALA